MPSSYPHLLWRLQAELRRDSLTLQTHPSPSRGVAVSNRYREGIGPPYDSVTVALDVENGWLQERELLCCRNAAYGNDRGSDPPRQASRTPIKTSLLRDTSDQRIKFSINYLSE